MKKIRIIHIQALVFYVAYYIFSNLVFVGLVTHKNTYVSYFGPFVFAIISSFCFLYFFSHKDFFGIIGELEKVEAEKENTLLGKFVKYGKYVACIIISQVGGPIFLALTVRFLFRENQNRYLIVFISTFASTLFGVLVAKGLLSFMLT